MGRKILSVVCGGLAGGALNFAIVMNLWSIPHPTWFAILDLILYVPCGIAGAWLAPRPAVAAAPAPAAG